MANKNQPQFGNGSNRSGLWLVFYLYIFLASMPFLCLFYNRFRRDLIIVARVRIVADNVFLRDQTHLQERAEHVAVFVQYCLLHINESRTRFTTSNSPANSLASAPACRYGNGRCWPEKRQDSKEVKILGAPVDALTIALP